MSGQETKEVSGARLESPAWPTAADRALWDSLSPEEQRALIALELEEAEKSEPAESASMDDLIARVRASRR